MSKDSFPARLRTARKTAGLTLEQLAKKAGCTKSLISQYELGRVREPRMELLFALADALNVAPRWLTLGVGMQHAVGAINNEERNLIAAYRTLPKPLQEHLSRVVESLSTASDKPSIAAPFGRNSLPARK